MTHHSDKESPKAFPALSKRSARRIIQRAWVLTGRDRRVRQHLRAAEFSTLWVLADWNFTWTVVFDRGHAEFDRRPAKRPDVNFTWQAAADFFTEIESGTRAAQGFHAEGDPVLLRICEPVYKTFSRTLQALLRQPVDEDGESLI